MPHGRASARPPWSRGDIDRLGQRLAADALIEGDEELLAAFRSRCIDLADHLAERLAHETGRPFSSRVKSLASLLPKLASGLQLSAVRDVVGLRVVVGDSLAEQDRVRDQIVGLFEKAKVIDRREKPVQGYRALHVEVRVGPQPAEIQIRTRGQDAWAQVSEAFADRYGRGYRYGDVPDGAGSVQTYTWGQLQKLAAQLEVFDRRPPDADRPAVADERPTSRAAQALTGLTDWAVDRARDPIYQQLERLAETLRTAPPGSLGGEGK